MSNLKDQLIRLGSKRPELRAHLRPILDELGRHRDAAGWGSGQGEWGSPAPDFLSGRERQKVVDQILQNRGDVVSVGRMSLSEIINRLKSGEKFKVIDKDRYSLDLEFEDGSMANMEGSF